MNSTGKKSTVDTVIEKDPEQKHDTISEESFRSLTGTGEMFNTA